MQSNRSSLSMISQYMITRLVQGCIEDHKGDRSLVPSCKHGGGNKIHRQVPITRLLKGKQTMNFGPWKKRRGIGIRGRVKYCWIDRFGVSALEEEDSVSGTVAVKAARESVKTPRESSNVGKLPPWPAGL